MKPFEFADLIEEFGKPFTYYEETEGYWHKGEYIEGSTTPVQLYGVFLPLSEDDLQYSEAGTYSAKDKKLYTTVPLKLNAKIEYKSDFYTVQGFKDYSDHSDTHIYIARWREK
ncbi:hypothetical protein [Aeribacillus pallidus]|uniref:hypothetical protein n=1 Tax=Aeribacillus pallidus TaxID=33936 RepID=UPI000E354E56|nr:hypothetical protein [Aeribacillus pallidus]